MSKQIQHPCIGGGVPALRCRSIGIFSDQRTAEPVVQQVGYHQEAMSVCKLSRLHLFMRVKLKEGIERQHLNTGALVKGSARNMGEDLLRHAIRARVAILEGLAE